MNSLFSVVLSFLFALLDQSQHVAAKSCTIDVFAGYYHPGRNNPSDGGDGGAATGADFIDLVGTMFTNSYGDMLIADYGNCKLRKVDMTTNIVSTFSGVYGDCNSAGNGQLVSNPAVTLSPYQMCSNTVGDIFLVERANHVVRRIAPNSIISAFAGVGNSAGDSGENGAASSAKLNEPTACVIDSNADIYISSRVANKVKKVGTDGMFDVFALDLS